MVSQKPTILIISGAWHFPSHYAKLKAELEAAGFEVHIPQLATANGARPPTADLYTDTELIRGQVTNLIDQGREIIVIMHSYGGQVGTNALHGLGVKDKGASGKAAGVVHLVYLCAAAYLEGVSMFGRAEQIGMGDLIPMIFPADEDRIVKCADPKAQMFGPDINGPEIDAYVASMGISNLNAMQQPIQNTCAWKEIPVTYIQGTQDLTIPIDFQELIVADMEKEGVKVQKHQLVASHCPNFTHAAEITAIVRGLDGSS